MLFYLTHLMGRDNYWYINVNKIKLSKKINLIGKKLIFNPKKFKNIFYMIIETCKLYFHSLHTELHLITYHNVPSTVISKPYVTI